jgi:integrase
MGLTPVLVWSPNNFLRQGVPLEVVQEFLGHVDVSTTHGIYAPVLGVQVVRGYAQLAVKAGTISREEGMLVQGVKGFSRAAAANVDEKRVQTRIVSVTYDYKPDGRKRRVVVTRQSTKKARPRLLSEAEVAALMQLRNDSPQAWRDALLMCLLLEHGLRASGSGRSEGGQHRPCAR